MLDFCVFWNVFTFEEGAFTMAYKSGKKPTLKEKFNTAATKTTSALKKIALAALLAAGIGGYPYGTMDTQEVKVTGKQDNTNWGWNKEAGRSEITGNCRISTDKGSFVIDQSLFHMQSQQDVIDICDNIYRGNTYRLETYGLHIAGDWQPNIIGSEEVSKEELESRKAEAIKLKEEHREKKAALADSPTSASAAFGEGSPPSAAAQSPAGTGEVVTYPVIVGNCRVQITIPAEVVGRVVVNACTPVAPAAAPKPSTPPGPG